MKRATGRPQGRRGSGLGIDLITVSFSLPEDVVKAIKTAASRRSDMNKSAEVSEVLAQHYGITVPEGGEPRKTRSAPIRLETLRSALETYTHRRAVA